MENLLWSCCFLVFMYHFVLFFFYIRLGIWFFMMGKESGVVLRVLRYGDNGLIVDIFTPLRGMVSFMVRLPKARRKAMVRGVFFRPLTVLELDYNFRLSSSLQHLADVRPLVNYRSLPYHPYKSAVVLFLSEFLYRALRNESGNASLFSYVVYSLEWFDAATCDFADFHLVFLCRLTRFLGFCPNVCRHGRGEYFDMINACYTSVRPMHSSFLEPDEAAYVSLFMHVGFASMHHIRMSGKQRCRCLNVIVDYYKLHIPGFPDIRSLEVLRDVFSS